VTELSTREGSGTLQRDGVGISRERISQDDPDEVLGNFVAIGVDSEAGRERIATILGDETGDIRRFDGGDRVFDIAVSLC
jgi:hypothetical protein